jgi:hypothetical protein
VVSCASISQGQVCLCAEAEEADFAREKEDVMKEIELLQLEEGDSVPLSEGMLRSQSITNSREIGSFQSIPGLVQSSASGSHRALYNPEAEGVSGQFLSQPLLNLNPSHGAPPPSDNNGSVS